jgi:hypothetical protein
MLRESSSKSGRTGFSATRFSGCPSVRFLANGSALLMHPFSAFSDGSRSAFQQTFKARYEQQREAARRLGATPPIGATAVTF